MYNHQCNVVIWATIAACLIGFLPSSQGYSPREDARMIAAYKRELELNHAKIGRQLVHQATWASVGTISTNKIVENYPMVNIISVDDSDVLGNSTGRIRFMLTDLDFTGPDWQKNNKVTFMFTDAQNLNCQKAGMDPMEPTCARIILSGQVKKMEKDNASYKPALEAFLKRHPAGANWMKFHTFYLCELVINNIFVLDFYGGPHEVSASDYYAITI
ncbi:protein CREG1 [Drosophila tropicalis]|uniref:protein CREG1 n=1 Tax=Drosophila tropicalis TaxID=46794 RepID=UPI0035ABEEE1